MIQPIKIKNTTNLFYTLFSYNSYTKYYKTYILTLIKRNFKNTDIIKHHFLFIEFWYKLTLTHWTMLTAQKLYYFLHRFTLNVHTGKSIKQITYYTNNKLIHNNKLLFSGEFIFTRKFFTFKQAQPRVAFKILKKKKNRQINKLKKINKLK